MFHVFTGSFYITACIMFNPADAFTNIESAVKRKSYSLLSWTIFIYSVPSLFCRLTSTFVKVISSVNGKWEYSRHYFWAYLRSSTRSWKNLKKNWYSWLKKREFCHPLLSCHYCPNRCQTLAVLDSAEQFLV